MCALLAALDERDQARMRGRYHALKADASTEVGSQAVKPNPNIEAKWPQYSRGKESKAAWTGRNGTLRQNLNALYAQFREALRQSPAPPAGTPPPAAKP